MYTLSNLATHFALFSDNSNLIAEGGFGTVSNRIPGEEGLLRGGGDASPRLVRDIAGWMTVWFGCVIS